jgi:hypothetical protein
MLNFRDHLAQYNRRGGLRYRTPDDNPTIRYYSYIAVFSPNGELLTSSPERVTKILISAYKVCRLTAREKCPNVPIGEIHIRFIWYPKQSTVKARPHIDEALLIVPLWDSDNPTIPEPFYGWSAALLGIGDPLVHYLKASSDRSRFSMVGMVYPSFNA